MCAGNPGTTEFAWNGPQRPELSKWTCLQCKTVMRWAPDGKPPEKCWSCGAPEKAK